MSPYLNLTIALESNDFETIASLKEIINLKLDQVMELYLNAISVTDALINLI